MTIHVFIDTNILLNFFHFTKEDIDALNTVFASHEHGEAAVYLTEQIRDEFFRNRENKIKDALKTFSGTKFSAQLPAFMKQYEEYTEIKDKAAELQALAKELKTKVDSDVVGQKLLADILIKDILEKKDPIATTRELFEKAHERMLLGNPPGKNGSLGDAVNWVSLLESVPEGENIHVISEDSDYYSPLDELRPHPFLAREWNEKKGGELLAYRNLSSFLSKHFDGVAFWYDKDKKELIEDLAKVSSFAGTHGLIAKLEQFGYFSLKEVEQILTAAVSNDQFGWIVMDDDVYTFLNRVAVPRMSALNNEEHVELLHDMLKNAEEMRHT